MISYLDLRRHCGDAWASPFSIFMVKEGYSLLNDFHKTNSLDETSFIAGKGKAAGVTEIYNENGQVHFQFKWGR